MKKSDVETHYEQGSGRHPAVNVKKSLWIPDLIRKYKGNGTHEFSDDAGFWAWLDDIWERSDYVALDGPDEWARESCWEEASETAHAIWPQYSTEMVAEMKWFPDYPKGSQHRYTGNKVPRKRYHVNVYSQGRSGGWCAVHGLPDIEEWDAIALGRWAKFEKAVRHICDEEYPYDFIWQCHENLWERDRDERANAYPAPAYA